MKELIKQAKKDKVTFYLFIGSIAVALATLIFILIFYFRLPPFVPVFNQLPWGEQRLTPTIGIFTPLILLSFVILFNLFFSSYLYLKNNPLLGRMLASVTLLISIMNFIFIAHTILLII